MQRTLKPIIAIPIAIIALSVSIGIWYYLVRQVPKQTQLGTIEKIEFFSKERKEKSELRSSRNNSGVKTAQYTLPNRFIYTIKLEDGKNARYQENAHNAKSKPEHSVGEKLKVVYTVRELPFSDSKILVWKIE
ncbi:hypothetical protein QSV08_09805 [Maribacter sp. BPC-D8]|uniref:hypothetical protein n=1 Tax=Maribacter sp. BPC-D8 TaxID=3053613 RepID=UPI002B470ADF|nr:hypothetical protein [Maribacter sp. BPC-D8]WRI31530.1 hypothetical protein QSV08_09805 [Maribacter sp. BPC-D8]